MRNKLSTPRVILLIIVITILLVLLLLRFFSARQIDDISPGIPCERELLEKSDILFVIPSFENKNISDDKAWCNEILSLNKTLALHGYHHNYNEFLEDKNQEYLNESIKIFEQCFNQTPEEFKPPQLAISKNNKGLIKHNNIKLDLGFNQITHKAYHCSDTGKFPNWFMDWF